MRLRHTLAYVSIRQHTSAYLKKVGIRRKILEAEPPRLERQREPFLLAHLRPPYASIREHT